MNYHQIIIEINRFIGILRDKIFCTAADKVSFDFHKGIVVNELNKLVDDIGAYDMYFDQKEFGLRVKYLRRKHGLTQEQLADALYITATHLSKIECGQRGISIDLLLDLAAELGVSVDFLISGNPRTMGSVRMLIAQIRELLDRVESSEMD